MADETTTTEQTTEEMTAQDFITQLDDLKKNTVSRADYDRLKRDNQQLANALVNGTGANIPGITKPEEKPDLDDLRKKLFTKKTILNILQIFSLCGTASWLTDSLIRFCRSTVNSGQQHRMKRTRRG